VQACRHEPCAAGMPLAFPFAFSIGTSSSAPLFRTACYPGRHSRLQFQTWRPLWTRRQIQSCLRRRHASCMTTLRHNHPCRFRTGRTCCRCDTRNLSPPAARILSNLTRAMNLNRGSGLSEYEYYWVLQDAQAATRRAGTSARISLNRSRTSLEDAALSCTRGTRGAHVSFLPGPSLLQNIGQRRTNFPIGQG